MKKNVNKSINRSLIYKVILILSLIGIITSIYLVKNHYATVGSGAICDLGESISCSLVNTSEYSELLGVPVAFLGAMWFVILMLMIRKMSKGSRIERTFLTWSILSIAFIIYMVIAEILLQSICPFCTLIHVILIIIFILAIKLYKHREKNYKSLVKEATPWVILAIIFNVIPLIFFNVNSGPEEDYSPLAQCLTEKGVSMYGSFRCGVCAKTKQMFGDPFKYVNEIECHPQGENSQTQLCIDKGIEGTPTWILEPNGVEIKRHTGFLSIDELREFSGCTV